MDGLYINNIIIDNNEIKLLNNDSNISIAKNNITIKDSTSCHIKYINNHCDININILKGKIELKEEYTCDCAINFNKNLVLENDVEVKRYTINLKSGMSLKENVIINKNATIKDAYVDFSNNDVNISINYNLSAINASANTRVGILGLNNTKKEIKIEMIHNAPYTNGKMENYGVSKNNSFLSIDGIGRITKGQYKSSNHQVNKIIVFDKTAKAKANPYLFVDEHDVKASHGASIGRIDAEHLYYLQSRGLTKTEAIHLVIYGYFAPVVEYIEDEIEKNNFIDILKTKVGL